MGLWSRARQKGQQNYTSPVCSIDVQVEGSIVSPENTLVLGSAAELAPYSGRQCHIAPCVLRTNGDIVSSDHKIQ